MVVRVVGSLAEMNSVAIQGQSSWNYRNGLPQYMEHALTSVYKYHESARCGPTRHSVCGTIMKQRADEASRLNSQCNLAVIRHCNQSLKSYTERCAQNMQSGAARGTVTVVKVSVRSAQELVGHPPPHCFGNQVERLSFVDG
ncbi:hypothetical protein TRVL_10138 [Trypanosoma vivax]|nr:hypothetical protein TRVL_10138 [Trypanosoma vivax]